MVDISFSGSFESSINISDRLHIRQNTKYACHGKRGLGGVDQGRIKAVKDVRATSGLSRRYDEALWI